MNVFSIEKRRPAGIAAIVIGRDAGLRDLHRMAPGAVSQPQAGVWQIALPLFVVNGATLSLGHPDAHEIRLVSGPRRLVSIISYGANLSFRGTRRRSLLIRSWNPYRHGTDVRMQDGRANISVRDGGRLNASDTRFVALGFVQKQFTDGVPQGRVSGVAVVSGSPRKGTGAVKRSSFVRNVFGAYTYGAENMRWSGNRFVGNLVYGFDPHTDSDGFIVRNNYAAHNKRHGFIFSRLCDRNSLIGNVASRNGWHGIVLDDGPAADGPSNRNVVMGNIVKHNGRVGISIDGSNDNVIRENLVVGGEIGIRIYGDAPASHNTMIRNTVVSPRTYGLFLDTASKDSRVITNRLIGGETAIRIAGATETVVEENNITGVTSHGISVDAASDEAIAGTQIESNRISGEGQSPILVVVNREARASGEGNRIVDWNYPLEKDIAWVLRWPLGVGLWILIFALVLLGSAKTGGRRVRRMSKRSST